MRNYFHLIDLDPSFRVGEEGELRMLQGDVAERILSEAYEQGSEEFHEFVEAFSTGRSDDGLVELIRKLYIFRRVIRIQKNGWYPAKMNIRFRQ